VLARLKAHRPRVLFVGFGDTDNWAHSGRYDLVLETAHNVDAAVATLWNRMQSLPEYRDKTTFIITADHGRGHGLTEWKDHGVEQKGSENIWIAIMGPDTPPRGERHNTTAVTQSQIAATIAALLGEDYQQAEPRAAKPLLDVLAAP
jgi:arylsulfatase A-like enzyme